MRDHCQRRSVRCLDQPRLRPFMLLQGDAVRRRRGVELVTQDMKTKKEADRTGVIFSIAGMASPSKRPRHALDTRLS